MNVTRAPTTRRPAVLCGLLLGTLLAGCGDSPAADAPAQPSQRIPDQGNTVSPTPAETNEELDARARAALTTAILHADSARLTNLRSGSADSICGEVAHALPGGRYSAPFPFVVTRRGVAMVSMSPTVNLRNPEDRFPDLYMEMCATPAELTAMAAEMDAASTSLTPAELPEPLPPSALPPDDLQLVPPATVPRSAAPRHGAGRWTDREFLRCRHPAKRAEMTEYFCKETRPLWLSLSRR